MTRPRSKLKLALQVVVDAVLFLGVASGVPLCYTLLSVPDRGLHCDDDSIDYVRHPDTVSNKQLILGGLGVPIILIVLTELFNKVMNSRTPGRGLKIFFLSSFKLIGIFMYGLGVNMFITVAIKMLTGRLRPHFLSTCQPDPAMLNCTHRNYVPRVLCSEHVSAADVQDARTSFPSGHASMAAFSATFLMIYFERRLVIKFSVFLKSVVDLALAMTALFVIVSRVIDNRHHVTDVLTGALLGVGLAALTILFLPRHMRFEGGTRLGQSENYEDISEFVYVPKMYKKQDSHSTNSGDSPTSSRI